MVRPKGAQIHARNGLLIKIIWRSSAFVNKVTAQVQVAALPGGIIQTKERQFDFRMSTVTSKLTRLTTKTRRNVIGKAPRNVQEPLLFGRLKMNHGGLDKMASAIEFVQIPEILESMLRTPGENMAVDVAVG